MAQQPQRQLDAIRDLRRALASGTMSPEEVRIALASQPYAAALLPEFEDLLEDAATPEALAKTLDTILVRAEGDLIKLPALGDQRVEPMDSREVAAIAKSHEAAREAAMSVRKEATSGMRTLIERSVSSYAMTDAKSIIERLSSRAVAAAEEAATKEAARERVQRVVSEEVPEADTARAIVQTLEQNEPELTQVWKAARASHLAREILVENPTLPTALRATEEIFQRREAPETPRLKELALTKAREEIVIAAPAQAPGGWGDVAATGGFFRALPNTNAIQRALAPAADVVLSVFPRETREKIVSSIFSGSFERAVDKLTKTLGEKAFVDTRIAMGGRLIAAEGQRAAATSAVSGVSKLFGDTIGAVFKKPMDEATISYLTEIHMRAVGVVSWQHAYTYHAYPAHPHAFHLELIHDIGSWAVRFGAKKAAGTAAKTAAGKVAAEGAKKGAVAILGKLGLSGAAAVLTGGTSLLAQAALWLGTSFLGKLWGGVKSFLGGLAGAGGGNQKGTDWVIAGVIGAVVLLPMLFFFTGDVSRTAPLATSVGGVPVGPIVDCARDKENPLCSYTPCPSCSWPTTGHITQGPRAACSSASHRGVNAIDIGANYQTPVYSTTGGAVFGKSTTPCADTSSGKSATGGCNSGYGNYIDIRTPEGYILRYAHLALGSIPFSVGAPVKKGDQIGRVDNNGNSSGHHLHFEVRSGPNIFSLLPQDFVAQYQRQVEGCSNSSPGCSTCPTVNVGG